MSTSQNTKTAIFAGGCFWCTEAVFQQLDGVLAVAPGYLGGHEENPTYESVCSGYSGHAEAIKIDYDPAKVSYEHLLHLFFATHDPTTINRQGNDVGSQYRSEIFYFDEDQRQQAQQFMDTLAASGVFERKIVTKLSPVSTFYPAEDYHHNYYNNNPSAGYCQFVVAPKIAKAQQVVSKLQA